MSDFTSLIERLEQAEAGSRELDQAIAEDALGLITEWMFGSDSDPQKRLFIMPLAKVGMTELPHYSTSLDAALTLVPEGWTYWEIRSRQRRTSYTAQLEKLLNDDDLTGPDIHESGHAATPALALCIACLKARLVAEQAP